MKQFKPHSSGLGFVAANLVALAAVLVGPFFGWVGLVLAGLLLFIERKSGLVKYYAALGVLLWLLRTVVMAVLSIFQGIFSVGGNIFQSIFGLGFFNWGGNVVFALLRAAVVVGTLACAAYGAYHALKWTLWKPPLLGNVAENFLSKIEQPLYNGEGDVPTECKLRTDEPVADAPQEALPPAPDEHEHKNQQ